MSPAGELVEAFNAGAITEGDLYDGLIRAAGGQDLRAFLLGIPVAHRRGLAARIRSYPADGIRVSFGGTSADGETVRGLRDQLDILEGYEGV